MTDENDCPPPDLERDAPGYWQARCYPNPND
jgi:hypothetical protein